jgi:hypothetical protein
LMNSLIVISLTYSIFIYRLQVSVYVFIIMDVA